MHLLAWIVVLVSLQHRYTYLLWQNESQLEVVDYEINGNDEGNVISTSLEGDYFGEPRNLSKRSVSPKKTTPDTEMTIFNVGVLMASHLDSPFDLERCGPAVDLALERVNEEFLKSHRIRLKKVQGR